MPRNILMLAVASALAMASGAAGAATKSTTFGVSAVSPSKPASVARGSGSNKLQYNLFTSVAATTIWGDGTNSTGTVPGTGAGMAAASTQTHTVFGQLPDNAFNQGAPTGTYNDSITVTVTY